MSNEHHVRAEKLITQDRIEGISQKERDWLEAHLRECARCSQTALQTSNALKALRGIAVPLPKGLADRTKFRVQLRARQLREREPRRAWLWIVCAMSWAFGIVSAPYVWQVFEWIGRYTGAPKLVLEFGFGLWWTIPAVVAGAIVLIESLRLAKENQ
ncbi:MAG TPA: hypothetical protein VE077_17900 [Candidatus Methylomirabilis sp.]|nr:hypothetical protein [Candidatus Methylomirabilis sp.]